MIKKIGYFLVSILIIVIGFVCFRYNPTLNYENKIPAVAETIIQLNLREIEFILVKDFVKNPFNSIEDTPISKDEKEDVISVSKTFYKSVYIPVNTFFYTNNSVLKNCFVSSSFKIKDKSILEENLIKNNFKKTTYNNVFLYQYKDMYFAVKEDELVCFYQYEKINPKTIIDEVFLNKVYIQENDSLIYKLKESKSPVTFVTKKNDVVKVDFKNSFLTVEGELHKDFSLFKPWKSKLIKEKSIINVSAKLDTAFLSTIIKEKQKAKFKKQTNLSLDSIIKKWNGDFTFNVASFKKKVDTIVTYEYDDDFNKVEKKKIDKTIVPVTTLILEDSLKNMQRYLSDKNAIKEVEESEVLVLNPFFKTFVFTKEDNLFITSQKKNIQAFEDSKKINLFFNVHEYKNQSEGLFTVNNKYFNLINKIEASLSKDNELNIKVDLEDESRSFLMQIMSVKN